MRSSLRDSSILLLLLASPLATSAQQTVQLPERDKVLTDKPAVLYSVGSEDGEEWELLSGVRQVAFDSGDNLYILDGSNFRVLVFDATGRFVRKIGKQGEGPGELMSPIGLTITTDGLVVVADVGRRGYSVFKRDGAFVKNVLFEEGELPGIRTGIQSHPRGGVVAQATVLMLFGPGSGAAQRSGGPTGERKSPVKWWDLEGKSTTLYEFTLPSITPRVQQTSSSGGRQSFTASINIPRWGAPTLSSILPSGGVAIVNNKDYRIEVIAATGRVERTIVRPIPQKKGTDRDKRKAIEAERENMVTGGIGAPVRIRMGDAGGVAVAPAGGRGTMPSVEQMLQSATFEETIPVLRGLNTDAQGRIWIARTPADFGLRGPVDIVRFDGTYIGTVGDQRVPDAVSANGRAAWIERDEMAVEHVVVKRLPAAWK